MKQLGRAVVVAFFAAACGPEVGSDAGLQDAAAGGDAGWQDAEVGADAGQRDAEVEADAGQRDAEVGADAGQRDAEAGSDAGWQDAQVDGGLVMVCSAASDCDDGLYCNGLERCEPGAAGAGADGWVPGCAPGDCAEPDADGDGHDRIGCGSGADCDDTDAALSPDTEWFLDQDGDGWGAGAATVQCEVPALPADAPSTAQWTRVDGDCDDTDPAIHPESVWYADTDADGFGDASVSVAQCEPLDGHVLNAEDCDTADPDVYPGAPELCDGRANDCDSVAWTAADETGTASLVTSDGSWSDVTVPLTGTFAAPAYFEPSDGATLWFCPSSWYVRLVVRGDNVLITGRHGREAVTLTAAQRGSVITFDGGSGRVADLSIQDGYANLGGGFRIIGGEVEVENVDVRQNRAQISGGGMGIISSGRVTLRDVSFYGNVSEGLGTTSESGGGAIFANGVHLTIEGGHFEGNRATFRGGAIYQGPFSEIETSNTLFLDNASSWEESGAGRGGAVFMDESSFIAHDVVFRGNNAFRGGAFALLRGSTVELYESELVQNVARGSDGGALHLDESGELGSHVYMSATDITANTAAGSGAATWQGAGTYVSCTSSTIADNHGATQGAATLTGTSDYPSELRSWECSWTRNTPRHVIAGGTSYGASAPRFTCRTHWEDPESPACVPD